MTRMRQLLDAGADPDERDSQGISPWMWAINFQDNDALIALLDRVSAISEGDTEGRRRLAMAASLNNLAAVRILLNKRVPADSRAIDGATPLLIAASSGYIGVMKVLLAAGARPNSYDEQGDTPLMAAARSGSLHAAELLLTSHGDPNQPDAAGRTALYWAARSGRADMVSLLLNTGAIGDLPAPARRAALTRREAVEKALPLLIRGWQSWSEQQTCGACHHRLMIDRVAALAEQRGFDAARSFAADQRLFFARSSLASEPRLREQLSSEESFLAGAFGINGDGSSGDALNLNAMLELGVPTSAALGMRALVLARKQLGDGRWRNGLPRVPILSSDFTITAVAARSIAAYGAPDAAAEISERLERARRWLIANKPITTDDEASRLLGLRWTHADEQSIRDAAGQLTRHQNADGSWSQLAGLNGDAYATGMVLVALRSGAGLPATDSVYERGVQYLLRTQEADGSWFVPKRAAASNAYFESGFPYGKFQFISYAASCWATMALLYAEPPRPADAQGAGGLVSGAEFAAGANLVGRNVKAEGTIFVPDAASRVRAVIVLVESWPDSARGVYDATGRKLSDAEIARLASQEGNRVRDPRAAGRDGGDLALGRFRDEAWRRLAENCRCALLHFRVGTIRPEGSAGAAANGLVIRNGVPDRIVRDASAGGADALRAILKRLGQDAGRRDLKDAPLLFWGWSAPGNFGTTFAERYPDRTVAFIRYHSNLRGRSVNLEPLSHIPALIIAGGKDATAGTEDAEGLWKTGRSTGAPWTFAIEPAATHANEASVVEAEPLIVSWITAVMSQRLTQHAATLRAIAHAGSWLGNTHTTEIGARATFAGIEREASWLPDETTARAWQAVVNAAK